jgi:methylated-DNA-protein-cysteine methyltransferase related protein
MAKKSAAFARIREEVLRLLAFVPEGKFTTYGSLATHMNVMARHVASILSGLTEEEAGRLPWHRVVGADARISPRMDAALAAEQRRRLTVEGMSIDEQGFIEDDELHFHTVGPRRDIIWKDLTDG